MCRQNEQAEENEFIDGINLMPKQQFSSGVFGTEISRQKYLTRRTLNFVTNAFAQSLHSLTIVSVLTSLASRLKF